MSMNHGTMAVSQPVEAKREENLTRVLKPIHLWALAVGLVISGNYRRGYEYRSLSGSFKLCQS